MILFMDRRVLPVLMREVPSWLTSKLEQIDSGRNVWLMVIARMLPIIFVTTISLYPSASGTNEHIAGSHITDSRGGKEPIGTIILDDGDAISRMNCYKRAEQSLAKASPALTDSMVLRALPALA